MHTAARRATRRRAAFEGEGTFVTESTEQTTPTNGGGLASLKLAQLQALASQLGIAGGSRMRKADLVTAISDHQRGGSVADRDAAERAAQALSLIHISEPTRQVR